MNNIMTVGNQEKLWEQIYHGEDKIGLIVTDMQYPLKAGEAVDEEAGFPQYGQNVTLSAICFLQEVQYMIYQLSFFFF